MFDAILLFEIFSFAVQLVYTSVIAILVIVHAILLHIIFLFLFQYLVMREASGLWVELVIWRDDWRSVWIRPGVLSQISYSTFLTPEWSVGNWDTMIPVSVVQICTCAAIIVVSIRSKFSFHSHFYL